MLNPFFHSKINFEQQKIVIRINIYGWIKAKKNNFVEQLNNPYKCIIFGPAKDFFFRSSVEMSNINVLFRAAVRGLVLIEAQLKFRSRGLVFE
jgi:hypothetical protein